MRKTILLFLLLLTSKLLNAQNNNNYLPNFIPPTPNAEGFIIHGKSTANEFEGKLNLNIPLYNLVTNDINLPITLDYNASGVRIDDYCTWTGINWVLKTGGVITRTIIDQADELSGNRFYINEQHMLINATNTCAEDSQMYYYAARDNYLYDTEIDIFRFSFNGYNGSFFLDENFNPVYIEGEHELKIEIIGEESSNLLKLKNTHEFLITTPDGVKYIFGGQEVEKSATLSGNKNNGVPGITAFYLKKIIDTRNNELVFEYDTYNAFIFNSASIDKMVSPFSVTSLIENLPNPTTTLRQLKFTDIKTLKRIYSASNELEIIFNALPTMNNNLGTPYYLNDIQIKSHHTLIKKIDFSYNFKNSQTDNTIISLAKRFFVEKIEINKNLDQSNLKYEKYQFEYDQPYLIPPRLSKSQDVMGYFNGKNNTSMITYNESFGPFNSKYGNRFPDFNFAKYGTLIKITYPSKGYSNFEYESCPAKKKKYTNFFKIVYKDINFGANSSQIPGYDSELDEYVLFPTIVEDQEIELKITTNSTTPGLDKLSRVKLEIIDLTDSSLSKSFLKQMGGGQDTTTSFNIYTFTFLKNHNYKVIFSTIPSTYGTNSFNGTLHFKLMTGYELTDGCGIRIKKQSDFDSNNTVPQNIIRYYYGSHLGQNSTISNLSENIFFPYYDLYMSDANIDSFDPTGYDSLLGLYITIYSDIIQDLRLNSYFPVVALSYGGDNFELGGIEKYYVFEPDIQINRLVSTYEGCWMNLMTDSFDCGTPSTYPSTLTYMRNNSKSNKKTANNYFNGRILGERYYKKTDGMLYKTKEVKYDYNLEYTKSACNLDCWSIFQDGIPNYCGEIERYPLSSCYLGYYHINTYSFRLNSKKVIDYVEEIPLSFYTIMYENYLFDEEIDYDKLYQEQFFKSIVTNETYTYGSLKGLPTEITFTTSESTVVNKTVNTYVNTASLLSGISSNQAAYYTSLLAQNRVASPVQTQHFKGGELLHTQRTLFNTFTANNVSKILPEKIQIAKGTQILEDKAIFYNYDEQFNPVIVGYSGSPKTRYMYNTEGLVVAKIENYTGSTSNFSLVIGNLDNTSCTLQNQYPDALVTVYQYNLITKKVVKVTDPNCRNTYYEYDDLQHLKWIKDHDGNIVKEFDQQFKPQN